MKRKIHDLKVEASIFIERHRFIVFPLVLILIGLFCYFVLYELLIVKVFNIEIKYELNYAVYNTYYIKATKLTYIQLYLSGVYTTIKISLISIVIAMSLGTLLAVFRLSRVKILDIFAKAYIEFMRNTPLLIQIFFWYYGTDLLIPDFFKKWLYGQTSTEFAYGVIALSIYTSAFIAEEIRAGIQSIPKEQMEASRAQGLSFLQAMRLVILPQAFRIVIPPLISQSLNLTKNSSLVMAIGVVELMAASRFLYEGTYRVFEALTVTTVIYLSLSLLISFSINQYNRYFLKYIRY